MKTRAYKLLKLWCDTLLEYKIESHDPEVDGAVFCPACHLAHGRIADLAFPLTLLYVRTGDKKYLEAADKFIDWSEHCLRFDDGSWRNDIDNEWSAISAFSAISIGEAILHFGSVMDSEIKEKWMRIFIRLSDYINEEFIRTVDPVINYYAGAACEQALAYKLVGDEKYLARAKERESICRTRFDKDGLFFGEMKPVLGISARGCRHIDMGYNLEESLPLLLRCSELLFPDDDFYKQRFLDHLEFLLPDGAIDDSFGIRHNKWTYWGSRTSDGVIEGLEAFIDEPVFCECARRALNMYEKCTKNGLLSLPMAYEAGEPTCVHHTFCHAKALAQLIVSDKEEAKETALIPCEERSGIRLYQNGNLAVVNKNGWRATVSAIDLLYADGCENSGGTMTFLMKDGVPYIAATMHRYSSLEPRNMQCLRKVRKTECMSPRIVFSDGKDNIKDYQDTVIKDVTESDILISGDRFSIRYSFGEELVIFIKAEAASAFYLPVIKHSEADVLCSDTVRIGDLEIVSDDIKVDLVSKFNQVGGFIYSVLSIPVSEEEKRIVIRRAKC